MLDRKEAGNNGKKIPYSQTEKASKIFHQILPQVQDLRKAKGVFKEIWYLQVVFQTACSQGRNPGSEKGQLVIATKGGI